MSRRKLEALRALAERPGTEAEGIVAREMLKRLEAKQTPAEQIYAKFGDFLRTGSLDDLAEACGPKTCDCGASYPMFGQCTRFDAHETIRVEMERRFPRGTRIYYNRWAYSVNCEGTIVGYSKNWNWARIKFDYLKNSRAVPVYSAKGWHISTSPIDRETLSQTGLAEGMENIGAYRWSRDGWRQENAG